MEQLPPWPWSLQRLHLRYRIEAELEALTGLRVGAGKQSDAAATDQPVIRDAMGRPFLPGSSIKGALRSGLESVLRTGLSPNLKACDLFADPCIDTKRSGGQRSELDFEEVLKKSCTACLLFGSPSIAGRMFVRDAALDEKKFFRTEFRDGVGIDRELGTARQKIKYDTEVVPVGSVFKLEIRIDNVDDLHLALVLLAVDLLHRGDIRLGGMTTRGLGRVALRKPTLEKSTTEQLLLGEAGTVSQDWDAELTRAKAAIREHLQQAKEANHASATG